MHHVYLATKALRWNAYADTHREPPFSMFQRLPPQEARAPAVPIKCSVTPDHLVCLEDGLPLKVRRRHLRSAHGLMPEDYRAKWGLPASYPMTAPQYTEQRSEFARRIGLGRRNEPAPEALKPPKGPSAAGRTASARRGRRQPAKA